MTYTVSDLRTTAARIAGPLIPACSTCNGSIERTDASGKWCGRNHLTAFPSAASDPTAAEPSQPNTAPEGRQARQHSKRGDLGQSWRSSGRVPLSTVTPTRVSWLWCGRIPLGAVTMFDGDPDMAKTTAALDFAARLSRGAPMPDGSASDVDGPAAAIILTAEDDLGSTIVPRLQGQGADLTRVIARTIVPDAAGDRLPTLADLDVLEGDVRDTGARLLIVDTLSAYLPSDTKMISDQDVRRVLAPLSKLAERCGVAILCIRHLNKSGGSKALHRGMGSMGIVGAARSALLAAYHPEDGEKPERERRRVLAVVKANLAERAPSLVYRVERAPDWGDGIERIRIDWQGAADYTAAALLRADDDATPTEERGALVDAQDVLRAILTDGPVAADDAKRQARAAGVADRTLERAKGALRVRSIKDGFGGGWRWVLPEDTEGRQDRQAPPDGDLGDLESSDTDEARRRTPAVEWVGAFAAASGD